MTVRRFAVTVTLKEGLLDPQGETVKGALPTMGWGNVTEVRVGKHIELAVEVEDAAGARAQVEEMAARFLTNPVIEDFRVEELPAEAGPSENGQGTS
ncbi:MAG TPA: phosphoribosylformylglycinamidine synthase subunit PurS [Actinomycetota bacterium]|nr:phosphoribosylformylglycinamidine synthase subunit PurS [Actinomycetota bacterium]